MISPQLAYEKFLQKINRNSTQSNISCDEAGFVLIINEVKNRWVEKHLKNKDSILIDSLRETIKSVDYLTKNGKTTKNYIEYTLEPDFYEDILVRCEAKKGDCKGLVYSRQIKNQNKNILEFDENQKPDFDWEWTFHTIQGNTLRVYRTDFNILKTTLEYYKVIPDFDIAGYININDEPSKNQPLILSDQYTDQIISLAATEYMRDFENPQGVQIGKDRENNQS